MNDDTVQIKTGKAVTMLQLLIAVGSVIVGIALTYTASQVRQSQMEDRIKQLEMQAADGKTYRLMDADVNKETDNRIDKVEQSQKILETQFQDFKNK